MMNLDQILDEIEKVSKEHLEDNYKRYIINNLYSLYKERKEMMGVTENSNTFIIDEIPLITDVDYNKVKELLNNYKKNKYVTTDDAKYILNWTVQNTRKFISDLGVNIKGNSLDGYCELAQFVTLYPLEEMGFEVTKNTAQNDFDYNLNHAFGTLTLNVKEDDEIIYQYQDYKKTYVVTKNVVIKDIDWSYLQNTKENKITLITCIENEPNYRRCVQGIEKK